ncbi:MAG: pseudouridine-5'-phosphate glycosidase [Ardenticatenia bacterium]|nr:pseudouridine-5'-phosphate glycosidase [Ardenticatenia bacterium]
MSNAFQVPAAFTVAAPVAEALAAGGPVVALETAVLTHGLPHPLGLETLRAMAAAVAAEGALPAVIGMLGGQLTVGLDEAELAALAEAGAPRKLGRRDLALAALAGADGGTTVSATIWAAAQAGIAVLATGGIGGVHRGAPQDVSTDLPALAQSPVLVVASGAKSLLDLPATLEVLETYGVPVLGYGTDSFPAFYVAVTELPISARVDGPAQAAAAWRMARTLGLPGGMLLAVPVPAGQAIGAAEVEAWVAAATAEATAAGASGQALTPWVLSRLAALSGGRTLAANRALLVNNGAVAGRVARALGGT